MALIGVDVHVTTATKLENYMPNNDRCFTLSDGKTYTNVTLFGLPEPIVRAFLDYYGDPNVKAEVEEPATEQV